MFQDSSESSDGESELTTDFSVLDLSYMMLDSESIAIHLKNSIIEHLEANASTHSDSTVFKCDSNCLDEPSTGEPSQLQSVKQKDQYKSLQKTDDNCFFQQETIAQDRLTEKLILHHNMITSLPFELTCFLNLRHLNLSNNNLTHLNDFLLLLTRLKSLHLQNNEISDDGLPKELASLSKLTELNLSSNDLSVVPPQIFELTNLKYLYLGNNKIDSILPQIKTLQCLQVLNLGGNKLTKVPDELGELAHLNILVLCENNLRKLPRAISRLKRLQSLLLHKNNLCCLPLEIVKLRSLKELGIRDNPLVRRFLTCCAKELLYNPPSLVELAARVIKLKNISYQPGEIPRCMEEYLNSGQRCVNPKCKGMYFTSCVEHVKFVDFCGMYRVPLMHYLCSSKCSSGTPSYYRATSESETDDEDPEATLKKILLG